VGKIPYNFKEAGKLPLFSSQFEIQWKKLHSKTIPNGFLDFFYPRGGKKPRGRNSSGAVRWGCWKLHLEPFINGIDRFIQKHLSQLTLSFSLNKLFTFFALAFSLSRNLDQVNYESLSYLLNKLNPSKVNKSEVAL